MGAWARAGTTPHSTAATARVAGSLQDAIAMIVLLLEGGPLRTAARGKWAFYLPNPAQAVKVHGPSRDPGAPGALGDLPRAGQVRHVHHLALPGEGARAPSRVLLEGDDERLGLLGLLAGRGEHLVDHLDLAGMDRGLPGAAHPDGFPASPIPTAPRPSRRGPSRWWISV